MNQALEVKKPGYLKWRFGNLSRLAGDASIIGAIMYLDMFRDDPYGLLATFAYAFAALTIGSGFSYTYETKHGKDLPFGLTVVVAAFSWITASLLFRTLMPALY
ncbi:hypothetical protein D477_014186 [Arthrobacter crystallopoietes BAB-32]|uniref:Uncharacterized protein n=1 Tax=Arthrobacter crystallopoietes BAB-32 TaxID=1246476 RepID=N1V0E6_9MICC|nr:hypothetical protein [Arthrobacter crystallopoietes]EMY33557.1 hypothetical protein D477_014186 [Arthrobacter crystallopoietes BAB-32]